MELALPFGNKKVTFELPLTADNVAVARRQPLPEPADWEEAATRALASPIGVDLLHEMRLEGQTVAILIEVGTDAPPADALLPLIIEELKESGAEDENITIIAATGDKMISLEEMNAAVGEKLARTYRCVRHDAFADTHRFRGFSALGTPIFINEFVADADLRISVGSVRPDPFLGYSGGDDAVLPGTAAFATIARHATLGFAPMSNYGYLGSNPARLDVENVGMSVGLDFVLNFLTRLDGRPIAAFAGNPVKAQRAAVNQGDRLIWGAELGELADIAIASPGHEWHGEVPYDARMIDYVTPGVKLGGTLIYLASPGLLPETEEEWGRRISEAPVEELALLHEQRNWQAEPEEVAQKLRKIREAYLALRPFYNRNVILVGSDLPEPLLERLNARQVETADEVIELAFTRHGTDAKIAFVPDASTTLCLKEFH